MCGDVEEGIELAVGAPHPEGQREPIAPPDWVTEFESVEMTPAERADFDRRERECDARLDDTSIMKMAETFSMLAHEWLTASLWLRSRKFTFPQRVKESAISGCQTPKRG